MTFLIVVIAVSHLIGFVIDFDASYPFLAIR
jgi:hypothetical protein